jgi:hypothetical protein
MNSGKTTVCKTIVETFSARGLAVHGGKVAGVACRQDLLALEQAGARKVFSFHDFGLSSSADLETLVPITRSMIHHLAEPKPDFIILEMGDGILGGYHVSSLFSDSELIERQCCLILCANDLMGTWGALQWLDQHDFSTTDHLVMISGPVTDSAEGVRYIEGNWHVAAANPFDSPGKIGSFIQRSLKRC